MDFEEFYEDTCSSVTVLARDGHIQLLKEAINDGRPTNSMDNRGWRPLHHAVVKGHIDCVAALLTADDVEVNAQSHDGITALMLTTYIDAHDTAVDIATMLFAAGADPNLLEDTEPWGVTLNLAIKSENYALIKLMLENGADPNRGDANEGIPLHYAAGKGECNIMKLLVDNKAELTSTGDDQFTVLHSVMNSTQSVQCLDLILNNPLCTSDLLNARLSDGTTPLMLGCQAKWKYAIEKLLDAGADPNLHSQDNVLPIHLATQFCPDTHQYIKIYKRLLHITKNDLLIPTNQNGNTVSIYHLAIYWNRFEFIKLLVENEIPCDHFLQDTSDAIIDMEDEGFGAPLVLPLQVSQDTPLSYLLSKKLTEETIATAHFLIQNGCSVNALHSDCVPPLVEAVKHRKAVYSSGGLGYSITTCLLEHGADVMYKARSEDPLPSALYISSLFNPSALFLLLKNGNVPTKELFCYETFQDLSTFYVENKFFSVYEDFDSKVTLWLKIVNIFIPSMSLECIELLKPHAQSLQPWNMLQQILETPKTLTHLCILAIRDKIGENKGWGNITQNIKLLENEETMILPPRILELLNFDHINTGELT